MSTDHAEFSDVCNPEVKLVVSDGVGGVRLAIVIDDPRTYAKFWIAQEDIPDLIEWLRVMERFAKSRETPQGTEVSLANMPN